MQEIFTRFRIRLTDEGELFLRLYCASRYGRISEGYPLSEFTTEEVEDNVCFAARDIAAVLQHLADKPLSASEENWLKVHIAARQVQEIAPSAINADDDEALVNYILRFINTQYNYNLLNDKQLHADLLTHIKTMITRVRYQIMIPNPLLENIKQHYPMAWDMTLAAVSGWENTRHIPSAKTRLVFWYCISALGWSVVTTSVTNGSLKSCWYVTREMRWYA
ncbi:BglB-family transcriptional antiterminator [Citrobacter koseri]|uniref:BglB-family transcriptional antiterminator n=1 Tax=Citrobacter koseri TaxID=545 RepID=A0A447UQD9_CITKO|nr:BglB-family transcriptional antiterminator [Citrobacter koseri]